MQENLRFYEEVDARLVFLAKDGVNSGYNSVITITDTDANVVILPFD